MANYGTGAGILNSAVQMQKLNANGPAEMYDPGAQLDAGQMAQQLFQQQAAVRSQQFNQENPRMALPQNFGAALGGALTGAIQRTTQPAPPQQGVDPQTGEAQNAAAQINAMATKYMQDMAQNGDPVDPSKAKYMAAAQYMTSSQSPVGQAIAEQYINQSKKQGYTPETAQAAKDKSDAAKVKATEDEAKTTDLQNKSVYQVYDRTPDATGLPSYKTFGQPVAKYLPDGTIDPDFGVKIAAQMSAAKQNGVQTPTIDTIGSIDGSKTLLAKIRGEQSLAEIGAREEARQKAAATVDEDAVNEGIKMLQNGDDPSVVMNMVGGGNASRGTRDAILAGIGKVTGGTYSPTDAHIGAQNEKAWDTGTVGQQFNRIQTVPSHLNNVKKAIDELDNGGIKQGNILYNWWSRNMSNQGNVAPFEVAKDLAFTELNASLNPRGGADEGIQRLLDAVHTSDTPASLRNSVAMVQKFWQDKANDANLNYTEQVPRKNFYLNKLKDPEAIVMLSEKYPIQLQPGAKSQFIFKNLPDDAWVQSPGGKAMQVKQAKSLMAAQNGQ